MRGVGFCGCFQIVLVLGKGVGFCLELYLYLLKFWVFKIKFVFRSLGRFGGRGCFLVELQLFFCFCVFEGLAFLVMFFGRSWGCLLWSFLCIFFVGVGLFRIVLVSLGFLFFGELGVMLLMGFIWDRVLFFEVQVVLF